MGTAEETVQHLQFDVEDTIFVAVGTDADDAKATLLWAVQNFAGKTFCLLHVHQLTPRATSRSEFCTSGFPFLLLQSSAIEVYALTQCLQLLTISLHIICYLCWLTV